MSRQAHLPPRCPFQKKSVPRQVHDLITPTPFEGSELYCQHQKSKSSTFEEQPAWLDDLLSFTDENSKAVLHRRSASDSVTLLDGLAQLPRLNSLVDDESSSPSESSSGIESACTYGPNSPRTKGELNFLDDAIVSALSDYVIQNHQPCLDGNVCFSESTQFDPIRDAGDSAGEVNAETKPTKRHPGQRSRVRKLQYIAELERTVQVFETVGTELSARVSSLLQQRIALSMENNRLKQKVARLQQEKMIVDSEYHSLRKEVERLKMCLPYSSRNKLSFKSSSDAEAHSLETMWQMLDLGKLDLN